MIDKGRCRILQIIVAICFPFLIRQKKKLNLLLKHAQAGKKKATCSEGVSFDIRDEDLTTMPEPYCYAASTGNRYFAIFPSRFTSTSVLTDVKRPENSIWYVPGSLITYSCW